MGSHRAASAKTSAVLAALLLTATVGVVAPVASLAKARTAAAAASDPQFTGSLTGLSFPDASNGWAVGTGGSAATDSGGMILHTSDGGASWSQQFAPANTSELDAVSFINTSTGWAVGNDGQTGGFIIATSDGGATWRKQPLPTGNHSFKGVAFADASHGWAVGSGSAGGAILSSSDGGASWTPQTIPGGITMLNGVSFASPTVGWAVGSGSAGAVILTTSDGGQTWGMQSVPISTPGLLAVTATSSMTAWAVGGGPQGVILKTTDGGANWTPQTPSSSFMIDGIAVSGSSGWAVGQSSTYLNQILRTTDGGATWSVQTSPSYPQPLLAVAALSATAGVTIGSNGCATPLILTTADGGSTWTEQMKERAVINDLSDVASPSTSNAWAVGHDTCRHGVILATTDGGANWHRQSPPPSTGELTGVSFATVTTGWATVGYQYDPYQAGQSIIATSDGGATWTGQAAPAGVNALLGIASSGVHNAWAVGTSGGAAVIVATTNGGSTWTEQTVPARISFLSAITFANSTTGWAVGTKAGGGPIILATTDGGATWALQTAPPGVAGLDDVTFADTTKAWAVGSTLSGYGVLLATIDGGTTWTSQSLPSSSGSLFGVSFASASNGWAVGNGIFATIDGGKTWIRQQQSQLNAQAKRVASSGASAAWTVGTSQCQIGGLYGGTILATTNGGTSWSQQLNDCPPFVPAIAQLFPSEGPNPGGTRVAIRGWGFTGASAVSFGGVAAASFTVVSDTLMLAVSPPGTGTMHVRVTTPGGVTPMGGRDLFTYLQPVAALPAMANQAYGGYTTAVYIQNTGGLPEHLAIRYVDAAGAVAGTDDALTYPLLPNSTWTVRLDNGHGLKQGAAGSALVYSDHPVAAFVNEFAPGNVGDATSYTAIPLASGTGTTLYAPAIASSAYGGYTTGLGVINTGGVATDVTITYRGTDGTVQKTQTFAGLAAKAYLGTYSGDSGNSTDARLPANFAGTATITSSGQALAAIINEAGPGGQISSYDAVAGGATTLQVPAALNNAYGGFYTAFGIENTSSSAGAVTVTYYDSAGLPTVKTMAITAYGYLPVYQGDAIVGPPANPNGYTAVIGSTVPVAAIVNEVAPVGSGSARQSTSYNTFAGGLNTANLPLVLSNGAWSTGEGIMNTGTKATTVTVNYYSTGDGHAVGAPQSMTLQPNAFWGLYQPSGGLPPSVPASAVITTSGGTIAVVCNESNSTSFMSYDGQ